MGTEKACVALRIARDNNVGDDTWQKMIQLLEEETKKNK